MQGAASSLSSVACTPMRRCGPPWRALQRCGPAWGALQVQPAELRPLTQCFGDRDAAMKRGMVLQVCGAARLPGTWRGHFGGRGAPRPRACALLPLPLPRLPLQAPPPAHRPVPQGARYEVHRHHPPLVYGRSMGGEPDDSVGAALCAVQAGPGGQPCYGAITFRMPQLSARMVPLLQAFCQRHLQQAQQAEQRQGGPGGSVAAG